jgi:ferric-dicitrate binding protein FerR (iron transport regulator)
MKMPPDKDAEAQRMGQLIALYIQGTISPQEHDELDAWVAESDANMRLFEELTDEKNIEKGLAEMQRADWKESSTKLLEVAARNRKKRTSFKTWLIAALFILLAGLGWWWLGKNNNSQEKPALAANNREDKAPGGSKALLTLADGKTIVLDGRQDGKVAIEGNVQVVMADSSLLYTTLSKAGVAEAVVYNTLSTPKGGSYALVLADGTKVWLNAASSIHFPTAFTQKERRVDIEGEAYFEVAPLKKEGEKQPFVVAVNGIEVEVLGTHFNVNAYTEEENSTVVLLEGAVRVKKGAALRMLEPGEQASVDKNNDAILITKVDAAEAIGWKDGLFVFTDADIGTVSRQLERWYDVTVEVKEPITEHFNATLPRTLPLLKVTSLLEKMGLVHFTLEKGKLQIYR